MGRVLSPGGRVEYPVFQSRRQRDLGRGSRQAGRRLLEPQQHFLAVQALDDMVEHRLEFGIIQRVQRERCQLPFRVLTPLVRVAVILRPHIPLALPSAFASPSASWS